MAENLRQPAKTEREWWAMLKSDDASFVRTIDDWQKSLNADPEHPLAGCDDETVKAFTDSLVFRNGGLAHAVYGPLEDKLTYYQFRTLWARFGLSMELMTDYQDKECAHPNPHTCSPAPGSICTSNC